MMMKMTMNAMTTLNDEYIYKINLHCLSFLSFIKKNLKIPTYHLSKTVESGGKSHCEIDAFYWHPIIAMSFSQGNSSRFSPIMPEEF